MKITEVLQVLSDSPGYDVASTRAGGIIGCRTQEILEMGQSRISSHLGLLKRNNLVSDRKDGKRTYYALQVESSPKFEFIRLAISENRMRNFGKVINRHFPEL